MASLTLDLMIRMSRGAVNGCSIPATWWRAIRLACPGDHSEIAIDAQFSQEVTGWMDAYGARSQDTFERKERHAQRPEPPTDAPRAFHKDQGSYRP